MSELSQDGRRAVDEIAKRHGVSPEAVEHVLMALMAGQGSQAQFNHPDLGGMGQWSQGGMTMVGDMFNNQLKARVDAICSDVAQLMRQSGSLHVPAGFSSQSQSQGGGYPGNQTQGHFGDGVSLFVSGRKSGNWWPEELGHPASTGAQNQMRYAWFPATARLAIDTGHGTVHVYDTGDHRIGGFSQQQGGDQSLSFTSQHGLVKLSELRQVDPVTPANRDDEYGNQNPLPSPLSEAQIDAAGAASTSAASTHPSYSQPAEPAPAPRAPTDSPEGTPEAQRQDDSASALDASHPTPKPSGPPGVSAEEADIFSKLERLAGLHAKGIVTDEEYKAKKAELLARI